jgi:autophagy-related protein 2
MPVDEYRKVDGHVVKGIQRGAESFGLSTAAVTVDIAQRLVGIVQVCYLIITQILIHPLLDKI